MAEDEQQERGEEVEVEAPETPEAEATPEAPEAEATPEVPEAEAAPDAPEAEADAEPAAPVHPKEARRRRRSAHTGEAREPRDAPTRQDERDAARREKAGRRRAHRGRARTKAAERRSAAPAPQPDPPTREGTGRPKVRQGVVVSDRPDKTITVRVDVTRRHRLYQKTIRSSATVHAHDERNEARAGDTVRVVESRPLSRTKRWRLVEVVERAR